jgi:hypothetical protein
MAPLIPGPQRHPLGVALGKVCSEGHRRPGPAAIKQCPLVACPLRAFEHGKDRGYSDASGDEAVARRIHQREVITGSTYSHRRPIDEVVMDVAGAAPAVRIE